MTVDRCVCGLSTGYWQDSFCPRCGAFNHTLYLHESSDPRPRSHRAIAAEYRAAGLARDAERILAQPEPRQPAQLSLLPLDGDRDSA